MSTAGAAASCRLAAATLRDVSDSRAAAVARLLDGWEGPHRSRFDGMYSSLQHEAEVLLSALADAARSFERIDSTSEPLHLGRMW